MKAHKCLLAALLLCLPAQAQVVTGGGGGAGPSFSVNANPNTSVTGTLTETNLAPIRIPANTIGPTGLIRLTVLWGYTNDANNKQLIVRLSTTSGGTSGTAVSSQVFTTTAFMSGLVFIRANNATNAQVTYPGGPIAPYGASAAASQTASSLDMTQDTFLNLNATLSNVGDTVTLLSYTVEAYR